VTSPPRGRTIASAACLLLGFVLAAALFFHFGYGPVATAFKSMGWLGFAAIVLFRLGLVVLMGSSWWVLGRGRADAAVGRFVWGRLIRDSASEVLPLSQLGGFVSGARAVALRGVSGSFATASTLVDLSVELVTKLPYALAGLGLLCMLRPQTQLAVPAIGGLVLLAAAAVLFIALQSRGAALGDRLRARLARRWPALQLAETDAIRDTVESIQRARPNLRWALAGHLASWFLGGVETWLLLLFAGAPLGLGAAIAIDSLVATLRSGAFFVPGALGVQEGGYLILCGAFGVAAGPALAVSLIRRARDGFIGVPALLVWQAMESARARRSLLARQPLFPLQSACGRARDASLR
jgi:putative membrane protein